MEEGYISSEVGEKGGLGHSHLKARVKYWQRRVSMYCISGREFSLEVTSGLYQYLGGAGN